MFILSKVQIIPNKGTCSKNNTSSIVTLDSWEMTVENKQRIKERHSIVIIVNITMPESGEKLTDKL